MIPMTPINLLRGIATSTNSPHVMMLIESWIQKHVLELNQDWIVDIDNKAMMSDRFEHDAMENLRQRIAQHALTYVEKDSEKQWTEKPFKTTRMKIWVIK